MLFYLFFKGQLSHKTVRNANTTEYRRYTSYKNVGKSNTVTIIVKDDENQKHLKKWQYLKCVQKMTKKYLKSVTSTITRQAKINVKIRVKCKTETAITTKISITNIK